MTLGYGRIKKEFVLYPPAIHGHYKSSAWADTFNEAHTCRVEVPASTARVTE